jgi:glycine/D-amino acid oxidase-like deaminating enzyme
MRTQTVAVVGAGFAGVATAYHLARAGARVVVLERERAAGMHASGQNAGILRTAIQDPALARVAAAGARGAAEVNARAPHPFIRACGSLLTASGTALEWLEAAVKDGDGAYALVTPSVASRRVPPLAPSVFRAALWAPGDGVADVATYLACLVAGAREAGASFHLGCEVLGGHVLPSAGPVRLETTAGVVEADSVVLAVGAWADGLAGRLGLPPLGVVPFRRHLHATGILKHVDPCWPFVWSVTHEVYFRPESGGLLLCACDQEPWTPCVPTSDPQNLEVLAHKMETAFPGLADLPIMRSWAGLRSFVPDHRFVLGQDARAPCVHWAAALGGHGVTSAWEVGRLVAEEVLGVGAPPPDLHVRRLAGA